MIGPNYWGIGTQKPLLSAKPIGNTKSAAMWEIGVMLTVIERVEASWNQPSLLLILPLESKQRRSSQFIFWFSETFYDTFSTF